MSTAPIDGGSAALVLQPDGGAAPAFNVGKVVQAKVLRHLDAGRYLVRLSGQDRVVQSAVPLRAGEVLPLRVAGMRERIEFERIGRGTAAEPPEAADAGGDLLAGLVGGPAGAIIEEVFRRYRGALEPQDRERLRRAVAAASRPERMALAGLVLSKAGLPIADGLLAPLYEAMGARDAALAPIPAALEGRDGAPDWWPAAQVILNVQGGGALAHRVGMIPLEAGDESLEVEVALFEERGGKDGDGPPDASPVRHRKLVLGLQTPALGRLELRAVTAGDHIRVALATESSGSTNALLRHAEALARSLDGAGWRVDEISHETRALSAASGVIGAAVEHIVTPGSVSQLV